MVQRRSTGDLYAVLGVEPHASGEEIVHAYRRSALTSHPDARPEDPGASARFRTLTDAYDVLSDPVQRADYDRARLTGTWVRRMGPIGSSSSAQARQRPQNPGGRAYGSDPRAPSAPLWAGPVHVEPTTTTGIAGHRRVPSSKGLAELATLLSRYVEELSTGWRP